MTQINRQDSSGAARQLKPNLGRAWTFAQPGLHTGLLSPPVLRGRFDDLFPTVEAGWLAKKKKDTDCVFPPTAPARI